MPIDWTPPTALPDLRHIDLISLDTETKDDGLRADRGSAWPWRGGYVAGISVAYRAGGEVHAHYFPLRHPDTANFNCEQVFAWLKELVASDVRFITQNGVYDWGWLRADGDIPMPPSERLDEIGAMAALIDECRYSYKLDSLCMWRGLPGKDMAVLEQAIAAAGFVSKRKKVNPQEHIWELPARFVGAYAEHDARATLLLAESLRPVLDQEKTYDAYRLEVDLLPMVLAMRRRGIRIDQSAAEQARDLLLQKRDAAFAELSNKLGMSVGMEEIGSPKWKAKAFDAHSISYPRTKKGNPSFQAGKLGWMVKHPHWLPQLIAQASKYDAAATKFIQGHILEHLISGRIHAEIHPHKSDDGGAKSLRFSYSDPPLQQMPSRDKELAPLIRSCFLPEEGEIWAKPDISQQEFRLAVHYAVLRNLPRAKEAADRYRNDPHADFHADASEMTGLERDSAKATNFAKIFGAGPAKFAEMIGKPLREAQAIYAQYDHKLPFLARLSKICQAEAKRLGSTVLYDGARRHWDYREAPGIYAKGAGPCLLEEAQRRLKDPGHPWYGHWIRRVGLHTAMNALIQGSAARHTKLWMRAVWREGITPLLQMHDCLYCSVTSAEQGEIVARLGCEAVKLEVPMRVDLKFGRSWGDAKHTWEELHGGAPTTTAAAAAAPKTMNGTTVNGTTVHATPAAAPIEVPAAAEEGLVVPLAAVIGQPLTRAKMLACPFHADTTPSMRIYDDPAGGHYHCFGCGAHGDAIDWLVRAEGMERGEALHVLEHWDGPLVAAAPKQNDGTTLRDALQLWDAAQPIAGTPAARYLAHHRRIDLAALPVDIDEVLRFFPRCTFGSTKHPCLLALMRDVLSNERAGIQRIALDANAQKIERRMLGSWQGARAVKIWPAGKQLVVGEGVETVLAAATRIPYLNAPLRPAWALLSAAPLARFPVLPEVEHLIILADNDSNGVGQQAADACRRRWCEAGRAVAVLLPDQPDTDFNDVAIQQEDAGHGLHGTNVHPASSG
jgi:DNA polymerase I-like protein with 3'-5' exonuclease and polymerase domains